MPSSPCGLVQQLDHYWVRGTPHFQDAAVQSEIRSPGLFVSLGPMIHLIDLASTAAGDP